jgi:peptidoglycan/LPS O-acetylase OafA/YrhL
MLVWNSDPYAPHLGTFQLIPQAWSVSLELIFYVIAPFLVRRHWLFLLSLIVATYLLRSGAQAIGLNGSGFAYRFLPFEIGFFLAGVLSHRAYAYLNSRSMSSFPLSLVVSVLIIGVVLAHQFIDCLDNHKFYLLVVVSLPALFHVSRRIRFDTLLGELSYPIYLGHLAVAGFSQVVVASAIGPQDRNWLTLAMAVVTILLSTAYVRWIDAPFERWRQSRVTSSKEETAPLPTCHGQSIGLVQAAA